MCSPRIIALLPAYNEGNVIADTIAELRSVWPEIEIILIDNNSHDDTNAKARALDVNVIFEPSPGKGRAIRSGLRELPSNFDAVFMVDADATYEIKPLVKAIDLIMENNFDLVVGTRVPKNQNLQTFRRGHRFGNRVFSAINRVFHSSKIDDALSGWRLMSHEFISTFPATSVGFELETEINAHARNFDLNVTNINVGYRERPEDSYSKLRTFRDGFRILRSNFRIVLRNRPFALMGTPGLLGSLMSIPLIYRSFSKYIETGLVLRLPSLMVGISLLVAGISLILIGHLLEEQQKSHIATIRQSYLLSLRSKS